MKKALLFLCLFAGFATGAWAQAQIFQLEGKVVTSNNEPLVGAMVEAQKNGATVSGAYTNPDGEFVMAVTDTADLFLKVTYLGYKTYYQRINAEAYNAPLTITMVEDYIKMDEVVVVGYGTQEKRNVTGSVAAIGSKDFENISAASVDQVLQGRAAGVQVYQNSGTPGGAIMVRIRGFSSISAGNTPFYVVDGVPINTGDQGGVSANLGGQRMDALSSLNPNDIESIEILKDASAAAIYGARASNGVVLITTKRGSAGKAKFNFNMYAGFQEVWKKPELLNAKEFMELRNEAVVNDSASPRFLRVIPNAIFPRPTDSINTRWMDQILRTALIHNYQLSASGGTDKVKYYISGTYFAQDGIQKGTTFQRFNPRLNLDVIPFSKFTLGVNMNMAFERRTRTANDNNIYGPIGGAYLTPAHFDVKNPDGTWVINDLGSNPIGVIETDDNFAVNYRGIGNAFAKYEIIKGLFAQTSFGIDLNTLNERYYNSPLITGVGTSGSILQFNTLTIRLINENTLTYKRTFNQKHTFEAIGGFSFERNSLERVGVSGQTFPNEQFRWASSAALFPDGTGFVTEWAINGVFGRLGYNYKEKYILQFNFRADGSSRFGKENRYGYFPGVSAAWRISGESFMQGERIKKIISDLKLRGSWGLTGNQNGLGDFASLGLFGSGANYFGRAGIAPTQLPNPNLKWETTAMINVGLDISVFDRLTLNFDWYQKNTTDLLLGRPLPQSSGFSSVIDNIGEMKNTGVDISLSGQIIAPKKKNGFAWNSTLIFSHYQNEVTKLYRPSAEEKAQPLNSGFGNRVEEGKPIGFFFGFQSMGVNPQTGDILFADLNGDGVVTPQFDRTMIGNPHPLFTGGFTNNFSFMGFDLQVFLQWSYGNDVLNYTRVFVEALGRGSSIGRRPYPYQNTAAARDRWRQPGDITSVPRATFTDPNNNLRNSSRFVEDGSYLRFRNVQLGYNFPASALSKLKLSQLRVFVQAQNLFTFTKYSGMDPEINFDSSANTLTMGTDFLTYPQPRTITFGLNVGF